MKRIILLGLLAAGVTLYSCSNGPSNESDSGIPYKGYVSNAERTPVTMDGKPVPADQPKTVAEAASPQKSGIDVNAPSDDKGVGPYANASIQLGSLDAALAAKGKTLFQTYCTACHTTTTQRLVGPGLKGVTKIRTPQWILNMIKNPIKMTKSDSVAKALKKELNGVQMTPMGLNKDQERAVLEYLRQNDGVE